MTENSGIIEQNQDVNNPPSSNSSVSTDEKMLKQSEVNELIGRYKHQSYEKGRADALASYQNQNANVSNQTIEKTQQNTNSNTSDALTPEKIQQLVEQEISRREQEYAQQQANNAWQNTVQLFGHKMNEGLKKYEDFDQTVGSLQLNNMRDIVAIATQQENTADIMYELGKNPTKAATLVTLLYTQPSAVESEIKKISAALKQNESAKQEQKANPPLSQVNPSTAGLGNGKLTVSDYRKMPWLQA